MSALRSLEWEKVREHYDERIDVHERLLRLHDNGPSNDFSRLLVGMDRAAGNYSAAEHRLGPKILGTNAKVNERLHALATAFRTLTSARDVPKVIRAANISYFSIGVGSEASCLMNPTVCWVANTRSIWTHLVFKHANSFSRADEELRLYRENDKESEMHYEIWGAVHAYVGPSMSKVSEEGSSLASAAGVEPGDVPFLWADAIASWLYAKHQE